MWIERASLLDNWCDDDDVKKQHVRTLCAHTMGTTVVVPSEFKKETDATIFLCLGVTRRCERKPQSDCWSNEMMFVFHECLVSKFRALPPLRVFFLGIQCHIFELNPPPTLSVCNVWKESIDMKWNIKYIGMFCFVLFSLIKSPKIINSCRVFIG